MPFSCYSSQNIAAVPYKQKDTGDDTESKGKFYIEAVHNRCKQEHYHTIQKESSDIGYMIQYPPAFHSRNQLQQTGTAQKKKQRPSARMQLLSRNCQCIVVAGILRWHGILKLINQSTIFLIQQPEY